MFFTNSYLRSLPLLIAIFTLAHAQSTDIDLPVTSSDGSYSSSLPASPESVSESSTFSDSSSSILSSSGLASSTLSSEIPSLASTVSPSSSDIESLSSYIFPSSSSTPSASTSDVPNDEMATILSRRIPRIVASTGNGKNAQTWLDAQQADGTWSDVDYTTGCAAQRANWPAQGHWLRIQTLAAAWHGGLSGAPESFVQDEKVYDAISLAMDWWFERDYTNPGCTYDGGKDACPCDDNEQHMYNTNWFANVIGIPEYVGKTCLLMGNDTLSPTQNANCTHIPTRSYETLPRQTGANTLDVAAISIDMALATQNESVLLDCYDRIHKEMLIVNVTTADGTRADGAFGQHLGLLYNGNYGKDYINAILDLETQAADTTLSADDEVRGAFATLIDADQWMIFQNTLTGVLHWDFSVLPRFISFPVIDNQATANLKMNLSEISELGEQWGSETLADFVDALESPANGTSNPNGVTGNRMWYTNDYMVHRGDNYVTTLKMLSERTKTSECTNTQNPLGFHLSDGTTYTYISGNEYEDIAAAWDWNLIPGTTTSYNSTPLSCDTTAQMGLEDFVGGVSNTKGTVGVAAMHYRNPLVDDEGWKKAWFFLENDAQRVLVSNITAASDNATLLSVLDQKRHSGVINIEGGDWAGVQTLHENGTTIFDEPKTLWHAGVGYTFDDAPDASLIIDVGEKTGDWSKIGTSKQPITTVDLFTASLRHSTSGDNSIAYTVFPGTDNVEALYAAKYATAADTVQNDGSIAAVYDWLSGKAYAVFWDAKGGSVDFPVGASITAGAACVVIFDVVSGELTVADPMQKLAELEITLAFGALDENLLFELPGGGEAGKGVTQWVF